MALADITYRLAQAVGVRTVRSEEAISLERHGTAPKVDERLSTLEKQVAALEGRLR